MSAIEEAFRHLEVTFNIVPKGVCQIGAHEGQERHLYRSMTIPHGVFIEPNPDVFIRLERNLADFPGYSAINVVCTEQDGEAVTFNIASNEESSSVLPLGRHGEMFPHIQYDSSILLKGRSIDSLFQSEVAEVPIDTLVLDTQGTELAVMRGGPKCLSNVKAIFTETSQVPLYEGGCTLDDLMIFLQPIGFGLKWMKMSQWKTGDALFVRD